MLSAIKNAESERKCLNATGRFAVDGPGSGRGQCWWQPTLPDARDMPFPASYNDIVPGRSTRGTSGTYRIKLRGLHPLPTNLQ
jgi:beta-glucuronidase